MIGFCDTAVKLAMIALELMSPEERETLRLMSPEMVKRYASCPEMKRLCQAGDLLHSAEIWLEHPDHDADPGFSAQVDHQKYPDSLMRLAAVRPR